MRRSNKRSGEVIDELIANPHRLRMAHICMGLASSGAYWLRPGTFTPYLPGRIGMGGSPSLFIVIDTALAWLPYLIAMFIAQKALSDRDPVAVWVYIALATIVTLVSICLWPSDIDN
jgi:hypothetical protein